jgi:hypothetical protein
VAVLATPPLSLSLLGTLVREVVLVVPLLDKLHIWNLIRLEHGGVLAVTNLRHA